MKRILGILFIGLMFISSAYAEKQTQSSPYPGLVFRETFNDEATVRKNGGVPTDVDFSEEKGKFDGTGYLLNNNKFILSMSSSVYRFYLTGDGGLTTIYTNPNTLKLGKWIFIAATRGVNGDSQFYLGNKDNAPAAENSGNTATPVDGTTNVRIGLGSNSIIPKLKVVEGILSLEDITQYWSSTRQEIE